MSIYAHIKFNMKDGFKEPDMSDGVQGNFRDVVLDVIEEDTKLSASNNQVNTNNANQSIKTKKEQG